MDVQQVVNAIGLASVYALFAVGYTLEFGVLRIFNIAHAPLYMLAAVALFLFVDAGITVWIAIPVSILLVACVGVLIERIAVRPLRRANAGTLPIFVATIAVAAILTIGVQLTFGANVEYLPRDLVSQGSVDILGATASYIEIAATLVALLSYAGLAMFVRRTRLGRAMRAVAQNPEHAERVGVSSDAVYTIVFFISSAMAAIAGVVGSIMFSNVYSQMHLPLEFSGFAVIVLGGLGSVVGALIGAIVLAFSEVITVAYATASAREFVAFVILFLVLVLRPQGLFGRTYREV